MRLNRRNQRLLGAFAVAVLLGLLQVYRDGGFGGGGDGVPELVTGRARLVDGDSFHIARHEVRLVGIDAPEGRQLCERDGRDWACGEASREALERFIAGRDVECRIEKRDQHGRLLGVCRVGGTEINRWQVEEGWAVAFGRYRDAEARARTARRGIWVGTFRRPSEWRAEERGG
ncbi:MAG: thermonuclease family protein [Rhizobiales bacterium]|nr:thermonuclease family protein [Hyphomicrobiales bacterium]